MKVSIDDDPPEVFGVKWRILRWDTGITEGGSSGAPLYDPAGRVIGHMDEGASSCFAPVDDRCTRLSLIAPMISRHLDPLDTGIKVIDHFDPSTAPPMNFAVTGIHPPEIPVLSPGTDKTVQVLGTGFTPQSQLNFNGMMLDPESWDYLSPQRIVVDMPKVPTGPHSFTVIEGFSAGSATANVVEVDHVVHQSGNGDMGLAEGNTVNRTTGVDITFAGPVGHQGRVVLLAVEPAERPPAHQLRYRQHVHGLPLRGEDHHPADGLRHDPLRDLGRAEPDGDLHAGLGHHRGLPGPGQQRPGDVRDVLGRSGPASTGSIVPVREPFLRTRRRHARGDGMA